MARKRVIVRKGDTVRVHYSCKLANGTIVSSSSGMEPLEFTIGNSEMLRGLEKTVTGMKIGQTRNATVTAEQAYGLRHEEWMIDVVRDKLPEDFKPEIGLHYEIPREDGQSSIATVTHISQSTVTLDFNHPLAGQELFFEVSVLELVS
jgi:peptidylprolyl isomerase